MKPTCEQQRDFFAACYLGNAGSLVQRCISRAYRDMNRTLHGIGSLDPHAKADLYSLGRGLQEVFLLGLEQTPAPAASEERESAFDEWHGGACTAIQGFYNDRLGPSSATRLHYGQAQKWLNMSIKYCWMCWETVELDLSNWYPAAHVPVDQYVLTAAARLGIQPRPAVSSWSRWDNAEHYQIYQKELRQYAAAHGLTPLQLEHQLWLGRDEQAYPPDE